MIEFNGISSTAYGLVVQDHGRRQRAQEDIKIYEVPNRNGSYREHTGFYKAYERPMSFHLMDMTKKDEIFAWLKGYGVLRTTVDPNHYFKASVISDLNVEDDDGLEQFEVTMEIDPPFAYREDGAILLPYTVFPIAITNLGMVESEPYMKITGSGNINVTVNSEVFSLSGVVDYIEIDSELQYVYRDTLNKGDMMIGKFPKLKPGINNISVTGTVTRIDIIPRWRDL